MSGSLRELATQVHRMSGITLRDVQLGSLRAALRRIEPSLSPSDLLDDPDPLRRGQRLDRLIDEVTVNETFFLRHVDELADLEWTAMAARAANQGRAAVRVWSAACSSGEEPYTLAMLAAEALETAHPPVDILATDISGTALGRARLGVYGTRSTRLLDEPRRERWFSAQPDGLVVGDELRAVVRLERHNLVRDPIPPGGESPFDLIVCRNVLIYFDADTVARTTVALREALAPDGQLLLGTADRLGFAPAGERGRVTRERHAPPAQPRPERRRRRLEPLADAPASSSRRERRATPADEAPQPRVQRAPERDTTPAHDALEAGVRGLSDGNAQAAAQALRRALYFDPELAVAALQLGRAHEELGDLPSARRAYWRALQLAEEAGDPDARLYDRVGAGDVAAACRARLSSIPTA